MRSSIKKELGKKYTTVRQGSLLLKGCERYLDEMFKIVEKIEEKSDDITSLHQAIEDAIEMNRGLYTEEEEDRLYLEAQESCKEIEIENNKLEKIERKIDKYLSDVYGILNRAIKEESKEELLKKISDIKTHLGNIFSRNCLYSQEVEESMNWLEDYINE